MLYSARVDAELSSNSEKFAMLTRIMFMLAAVGCGIVVLSGAWPTSIARVTSPPKSTFAAKSIPLDADVVGSGVDAVQLLDKALAKLAEDDSGWLYTKVRQVSHDAGNRFVAEGFLQRGPNQCARLEMEITQGATHSQVVVVSDGETLAYVQRLASAKPTADIAHLPAPTPEQTSEISKTSEVYSRQPAREAFLTNKGCGGPAPVLAHLRRHLRNAKLRTGLCDDVSVIQIHGDLDPATTPAFGVLNLTSLEVSIYLDARTLWLQRVEWSGAGPKRPHGPVLDINFRAHRLGGPLGDDECVRLFSYHSDGSEHITAP
jgi:hypothetical protein